MRIPVFPAFALCGLLVSTSGAAFAAASPAPAAAPTMPPQIYETITRPLCSALASKIRPAVAMMIQDDAVIAKGPPLFGEYIKTASAGSDAGKDMAIYHLNNLVTPLVQNTLAIQKLLEDPSVFPTVARNDDDKELIDLKDKMLKALASQQASLDIINGFVQTQQLGEMQNEGMGYLKEITGQAPSQGGAVGANGQLAMNQSPQMQPAGSSASNPSAPPNFDDLALQAGVQPNQFEIDPTQIPGLQVGYNPIGKLKDGLVWTQDKAKQAEQPLALAVIGASQECGAQLPASAPSPKP
ncbi:MAG TPA: hypothetical protein VMD47_11990 [Candidatus Acidoferrales bacterium]|nr:hypothetical protein [Candidatus Acidoferrales bacterium]